MFIPFGNNLNDFALPQRFTFPFYYEVHPLAQRAVDLLQCRLQNEDFGHDFGLDRAERLGAIGKMFGVLVVADLNGKLGYLAAFSGKLGNSNEHKGFVPPVFDLLEAQGFFRKEEVQINDIIIQIAALEKKLNVKALDNEVFHVKQQWEQQIAQALQNNQRARALRAELRAAYTGNEQDFLGLSEKLAQQSMLESRALKELKKKAQIEVAAAKVILDQATVQIENLRQQRAEHSADLQRRIFERYTFLNALGEQKNVLELFAGSPPAGAGECAAPKLLQYAYMQQLKPICMAEFWWGMSPDSEVRIHGHFYPSCKSKCEPILGHMLKGLAVDDNPITAVHPSKPLDIIYEDDYIVAVNKAPEYLSVPGKNPQPNTLEDLQKKFPEATGPLLVHRLDMSTSGIMLAAKTKLMHQRLQRQFVTRKVQKSYIAILEGAPQTQEGEIKLPLRVDLDDRPRQLVCDEHGSFAHTSYQILEIIENKTRILLIPHTGRTHQLRVHCAHHLGLNCPIQGDDLYGQKADRLYLHAACLGFYHPEHNTWLELNCEPEF
ncbi:MAG: RNA pseudouridine synthase [Sphingomonadales bacterium]|nr:RNA pseudouridine synthase [Sphingomonadales bacterium]